MATRIFFMSLDIYLLASWAPVVRTMPDGIAFVTSRLHFGGVLVCIAITPVLGP